MQIPVLRGRDFDERDVANPTASVLINETAAKKYFPNEDPIGQRVGQSPEESAQSEIVGIIRDTKYDSVRDAAPPTIYTSIRPGTRSLTVMVRTAGEPAAMTETVRDGAAAGRSGRADDRHHDAERTGRQTASRRSGCSRSPIRCSARSRCCWPASACSA